MVSKNAVPVFIADIEWDFFATAMNMAVRCSYWKLPTTYLVTTFVVIVYECFTPLYSWLCLLSKFAIIWWDQYTVHDYVETLLSLLLPTMLITALYSCKCKWKPLVKIWGLSFRLLSYSSSLYHKSGNYCESLLKTLDSEGGVQMLV